MEQAIFKTIVEMAYEMEACDMIERIMKSIEMDFTMFKNTKTRKHRLQNFVYANGHRYTNPEFHPRCVLIYEPVEGYYDPIRYILPMTYEKGFKGTVLIGDGSSFHNMHYTEIKNFIELEYDLRELLCYRLEKWRMFSKGSPVLTRLPGGRRGVSTYL
jgi:hypothetical protein